MKDHELVELQTFLASMETAPATVLEQEVMYEWIVAVVGSPMGLAFVVVALAHRFESLEAATSEILTLCQGPVELWPPTGTQPELNQVKGSQDSVTAHPSNLMSCCGEVQLMA